MSLKAEIVASLFRLWGLAPAGDMVGKKRSYHQVINMMEVEPGGDGRLELHNGATVTVFEKDADIFLGRGGSQSCRIEAPVVFAGYGISAPDLGYDDLAGTDLKDKIVLIIDGLPGEGRDDSPFSKPENRRRFGGYYRYRTVSESIRKRGAAALVTVGSARRNAGGITSDDYKAGNRIYPPGRRVFVPALTAESGRLISLRASERVGEAFLAAAGTSLEKIRKSIDADLKPHSMDLDGISAKIEIKTNVKPIVSGNVLGMIEGTDPELKNEVIVIGAHLDHIGMNAENYVFNGADDNASGSAGVLEVAQAFALNPEKPKRTILFACWTGEEKGLLGSRYFVDFPTLSDKKIIACLNMDMISRDYTPERLKQMSQRMRGMMPKGLTVDEETAKKLVSSMMSAQAPELQEIIARLNKDHVGLFCFPRPSKTLSGGSDHAPFHGKQIPAAFFMAAMTEDYHQPGDIAEKVNGGKMQNVARLVYLTAFEIANRKETLKWTEENK